MNVMFGNGVVDSKDIKVLIEEKSSFEVITDLSMSTKRDDVVAFHVEIDEKILKSVLEDDGYEVEDEDKEEVINEFMELVDDLGTDLEEILPEESIMRIYAYRYEEAEEKMKAIFVMAHEDLGERKLGDVLNRLLKQI